MTFCPLNATDRRMSSSDIPSAPAKPNAIERGLCYVSFAYDAARSIRLAEAERELPPGVAPELAPISTGLGEIYQFTVERRPGSTTPDPLGFKSAPG